MEKKSISDLVSEAETYLVDNYPLSFNELFLMNDARCAEVFDTMHKEQNWTLADWSNALAGEAGELCNKVKKTRRGENIPLKDLADEVADVVIYADLICRVLGISLDEAIISKFNEVSDKVDSSFHLVPKYHEYRKRTFWTGEEDIPDINMQDNSVHE